MSQITKLKKVNIESFRGLKEVGFEFGERITVISGKNGTSKSTILGIVAQVFSFRTDYSKGPELKGALREYKTLGNKGFESVFGDHFRFSKQFDTHKSMEVSLEIYDATEKTNKDGLSLRLSVSTDRDNARPILRGNNDRNITHPVIYLSLERLLPIAQREKYFKKEVDFVKKNESEIKKLSNQILLKNTASNVTPTSGTVSSLAIHGNQYDQDSISVGEDNTGQILQALLSFKQLKEELKSDYHGGLLLIDEADAGLFPAAQVQFIKVLAKFCKDLDIQVIMTSHSPILIQEVYNLEEKDPRNYKSIYLTDTYGSLGIQENASWGDIEADLNVETIIVKPGINLPKVNVYFEDKEAYDFFMSMVKKTKIKKLSNFLKNITLGCDQYLSLHKAGISEFAKESIIILDGDKKFDSKKMNNILSLPGTIPPDQLLFEFLYNLPANHEFWRNQFRYTKAVFIRETMGLQGLLEIDNVEGSEINVEELVKKFRSNANKKGQIRESFKNFYKSENIQILIGKVATDPFHQWAKQNESLAKEFAEQYEALLIRMLKVTKKVPEHQLSAYLD